MKLLLRSPLPASEPSPVAPARPPRLVDVREAASSARRQAAAPSLSVVIPCRNEAANLPLLLPRLREVLATLARDWEIVLVDDGSNDASTSLYERIVEQPGVRVLQLSRNFGKEAALTAGLESARGDVVVMMDADLQHPPALLPQLLQRWREGADVAYAVREDRRDERAFKRIGTRWFYRLLNLGDRFEVPADAGDFRLLDRRVVDALLALPERNRFMKGLYAWVGFDAVPVPYRPEPRAAGHSAFGPWRLVRLSIDGLTAFTTWPLRLVSVLGSVFALLGIGYGIWLTISYLLFGNAVSGWTTIVVGMMFLSGMMMLSMGIVGEYVARIVEEVKNRPLYVVKRELGQGLSERRP